MGEATLSGAYSVFSAEHQLTPVKKLFLLTAFSFVIFSCRKAEAPEKFRVSYNQTIETYFLAELLAVPYRKTNSQWENYKLNTCRAYQPMVNIALERYNAPENQGFARATARFCDTLVFYNYGNDIIMPILMQLPEFGTGQKPGSFEWPESISVDPKQKQELKSIIADYLLQLHDFYEIRQLQNFYRAHADFYQGAIRELESHIPKGFTRAMEDYYGEERVEYVAIVSPMEIWPIEEHEARGIAAPVTTNGQTVVYEIMSPYVEVPVQDTGKYQQYGYDYEYTARFLTVHEFSHSFVNPVLSQYKERIDSSAYLFTDPLREKMATKGVGNWWGFVVESCVRLGEIRIAALQGDEEREQKLREYHTEQEGFIFLPELEAKILKYEARREEYPQWKDFFPELLQVFESSDTATVNSRVRALKAG